MVARDKGFGSSISRLEARPIGDVAICASSVKEAL